MHERLKKKRFDIIELSLIWDSGYSWSINSVYEQSGMACDSLGLLFYDRYLLLSSTIFSTS